jgi:hypothetical protein
MAVENWQMPAIGAGAAFLGSIPQMVEARRLRKERERLMNEGAPGMSPIEQEQMAAARARAASALAPGYAQEIENINQQQADILGATRRAGISGSNVLNTLSRLNQQGQAARRNLTMRGAQAQRMAQGDLQSISMNADARRQARVQNWEAKMADIDRRRREYNAQAGMSPVQGALAFMPTEGIKFGAKKPEVDVPEMMETRTPKLDLRTGGIPNFLLNPEHPEPKPYNYIDLKRQPSMLSVPQNEMEEPEFEPNMEAFNPIMNTTLRRTYNPSRFPNTMGIESQIRTTPYTRFY